MLDNTHADKPNTNNTATDGLSKHAGRTVLFVITEDWFFHSHFMPMAKAAIEQGYTVGVAARYHAHREQIEALGAKAIDLSLNRGRFNPFGALTLVLRLYRLYRFYRRKLVHHISLKPIILGSIAARLARVPVMVNAITGFGYLFAIDDPRLTSCGRSSAAALGYCWRPQQLCVAGEPG